VISKKKFDMLIQQRLLRVLGMRTTTFSTPDASAVNPTSGARSTAEDYMKFLAMLLNKGMYNGQRVLSETAVQQMLQPQIPTDKIKYAPKGAQGYPYALGSWIIEERENGAPTTFSALSFSGAMPMLDICRRYAVLFFPKEETDEQNTGTYLNLKKQVDDMLPGPRRNGCE
jgi:CubicO group peptidase (beta-lactamase class C family)